MNQRTSRLQLSPYLTCHFFLTILRYQCPFPHSPLPPSLSRSSIYLSYIVPQMMTSTTDAVRNLPLLPTDPLLHHGQIAHLPHCTRCKATMVQVFRDYGNIPSFSLIPIGSDSIVS